MNLLYGEMAGSWLLHLAIPVAASIVLNLFNVSKGARFLLLFLVLIVILSALLQTLFLTTLQASSCEGVHNMGAIAMGAAGSAVLTGAMTAVPLYLAPARLLVSQLFVAHRFIATPEMEREHAALSASTKILSGSAGFTGGAGITPEQYEAQTWTEQVIGASYWAAFAGAYGVGLSSLFVARCS